MKILWQVTFAVGFIVQFAFGETPAATNPRGPVENPGMTVVADTTGVQAVGYQFQNNCQKPGPWLAKWIWLGGEKPGEAAMFRKEIVLTEAPQTVKAWLTADARYRLFINGRLVSRGPVDMGRDYTGGNTHRWFYDYRDLTPFFVKGTNVIADEVFRHWTGWTVSRGQPGFLFETQITSTDGRKTTVATDTNWHSQVAPQFPNFTTYDTSKEVSGWRLPGFDDAGWPFSAEAKDVWSPLVASEIPPLMEARYPVLRVEGLPGKVITNDSSFKVIFDRVLSGYPMLRVKGGKGAELTIKANNEAKMILNGGEQFYEFPHMTEIVPSFTVVVKHVTEPVEIEDVGANFTSQPLEYRGEFACNDEKLNRIYDVSRWAVQICLQTHHLDSPNHQEPISDPGDYLIESMVNYHAFAQPWLARQDIRKFAWLLKDENYHNFHTSYSIGWLQMLMDYYDYTGDKSLVKEMSPYVHELLDTYATWRGTNGIISEAPNYMFMDWVKIGSFEYHHPPAVIGQGYLTAFYYHGLEMAARVAAMTGDSARVEKYAKLRGEIAEAFNRELWVADNGLYRDGKPFQTSVKPGQWLPADKDIETFSPHVNALAVLYDLAPKENQAAIMEKVLAEKPLNTQPWFMHWVFQAIDHANLFNEYATPQMRRWQIVPETKSFREMWTSGDLSHGWCSTPLVQMSAGILGVTPAAPAFDVISIRPQLCDLKWAKGKVPTPHGDVEVSWTLQDEKFSLEVVVPPGAEANVFLPVSRFENPVVSSDDGKTGAHIQVASGRHHFEITGKLKPFSIAFHDESPSAAKAGNDDDADIMKNDLLHDNLASTEDHCTHTGGGVDAGAVFNGTTRNSSGGSETVDDGKTFRGYGNGDWLEFHFKRPSDLTEIRTFARHSDARASQAYTLLVAYAAEPKKFVQLATGSKAAAGGATEIRLPVKASGVVAVRFEFQDGRDGFNVYREFNLIGAPSN